MKYGCGCRHHPTVSSPHLHPHLPVTLEMRERIPPPFAYVREGGPQPDTSGGMSRSPPPSTHMPPTSPRGQGANVVPKSKSLRALAAQQTAATSEGGASMVPKSKSLRALAAQQTVTVPGGAVEGGLVARMRAQQEERATKATAEREPPSTRPTARGLSFKGRAAVRTEQEARWAAGMGRAKAPPPKPSGTSKLGAFMSKVPAR